MSLESLFFDAQYETYPVSIPRATAAQVAEASAATNDTIEGNVALEDIVASLEEALTSVRSVETTTKWDAVFTGHLIRSVTQRTGLRVSSISTESDQNDLTVS